MSKKRKDDDIIVTLCGGQSDGVTGSVTLISIKEEDGTRTLLALDMGLIQGNNTILGEYQENKAMLEEIPVADIDYVFIAHNHADHHSNLPYLSTKDSKAKVIMTPTNRKLIKNMLIDSVYIHSKNIEYLHSKGKKVKPLYMEQDAWNVLDRIVEYPENEVHKLTSNISFKFTNNSHVVGATQIELFCRKKSGQIKKILYTSDLGGRINKEFQPFLRDTEICSNANLMLIESTYGDREPYTKKQCQEEREDLKNTIKKYVLNDKKSCLVPVFSYGRLQSMMCWCYDNLKDIWNMETPIVIDTTLGCKMNDVYDTVLSDEELEYWKEVKSWKAFKYIRDYKASIAFQSVKQHALILSSSGMISAGRSTLHAKNILGDSKSVICFCGYCSPNTIGGKILNPDQATVTIDGSVVLKRCEIKKYNTFSSHAQKDDLINYIKQISPNCRVILHHGDKTAKESLREEVIEELSKINKTTRVEVSYKDMQIVL